MRDVNIYRGTLSRPNIVLSLLLVIFEAKSVSSLENLFCFDVSTFDFTAAQEVGYDERDFVLARVF